MMARRRGVAPEQAARAAARVAALVVELPEIAGARTVGLYAALSDELSTHPLFAALQGRGVDRALPRIGADGAMSLHRVTEWEELAPGRYGVLAPPSGAASLRLDSLEVLIVPGVAYDSRGARLGRGGGHYDRLLGSAGRVRPLVVGIGYAFQLCEEVPAGALDQRVDAVGTEAGVIRVEEGG